MWRRVVARSVDMITTLFVTLALVLVGLAPLIDNLSTRFDPEPWGRAFVATILYMLVSAVYEVVFTALRGQTPGKDLLDLKVVACGSTRQPSWGASVRRVAPIAGLRLLPGALVGTLALGVLGVSSPFDQQRRALHDRVAGTRVISYDADLEESDDDPREVDREDLAATYGPRSLWDYLMRWRDRG